MATESVVGNATTHVVQKKEVEEGVSSASGASDREMEVGVSIVVDVVDVIGEHEFVEGTQ